MIKKLFLITLTILLIGGIAFATPITSPGVGDIMGQGKFESEPHRTFRLVRYIPTNGNFAQAHTIEVSLTADSIVRWSLVSDDAVTITTTTQTQDSAVAGIVPVAISTPDYGTWGNSVTADIGRRNWGWLQTYGLSQATMNSTYTLTAGDAIGTGSQPGTIGVFHATAAGANGLAQGCAGFAYDDAIASATNVEVFLRCE